MIQTTGAQISSKGQYHSCKDHFGAVIVTILFLIAMGTAGTKFAFTQLLSVPSIDRLPSGELASSEGRAILPPNVNLRPVSSTGLALTKASEGWVPHLYNDAAKYCTIGYGHLIQKTPCDSSVPKIFRNGLTETQGNKLLVSDLGTSQYAVMTLVRVSLSDGQFAALTDFVFNIGSLNFRNSTLLEAVNAKQDDRIPEQFNRWVMAGGRKLSALKRRRQQEILLFFNEPPNLRAVPRPGEDLSPIDIRGGEKLRDNTK